VTEAVVLIEMAIEDQEEKAEDQIIQKAETIMQKQIQK
jgi:hypothetical protein